MVASTERLLDRARQEARRREHALLRNEHLCVAFAQVEWDVFAQVMRDLERNPHEILQAFADYLRLLPGGPGRDLRVADSTNEVFKLALLHAARCGRHTIEAWDIFTAIFEDPPGPVWIIRRHGIEPEALISRLATRMRDPERAEERPKSGY
jgi:ATP-dependent Clp protease ATP-binding subunit ClpA